MPLPRHWSTVFAAVFCAGASGAVSAAPPPFEGADLKLGERLIQEHRCNQCHARKVGGDGQAIYRPQGRINTPSALRTMVEYCSTELKLQLFPEDVDAIAAVLNRDHYHFR
jgi:cytochrome c2